MADLQTLLSKFLASLYAGSVDSAGATTTLGSATSIPSVAVGTGTTTALAGGTLFVSLTPASTVGTSEETLITYTMPASTLTVNNRGVRIRAWGSTAATVTAKIPRIYFGATLVGATISFTTSGVSWVVDAYVYRSGAATQVGAGFGNVLSTGYNTILNTTPAETLSGAVAITFKAITGAGADLTVLGMMVEAI